MSEQNPWGYVPGVEFSPRVRDQLTRRREAFASAWRRDPMRELALVLVMVVALVALFGLTAVAKGRHFDRMIANPSATFWMESAQRYRYVREVAEGGEIPLVDRRMQVPDGYEPRADTILQEQFYGELFAWFDNPELKLAPFVRQLSRMVSSMSLFGVALLVLALTRRRDAALLAALAYSLALPVAERGTGAVIFREDVAVPMLALHLGFLAQWTRATRWWWALLAGLALAASLLLWKVVGFFGLMVVAFLVTAGVLGRVSPPRLALAGLLVFAPSAGAALLPYSLSHDGYLTSTLNLGAMALVVAALVAWKIEGARGVGFVALFAIVLGGLRYLLPAEQGYDHAWETILARLQHPGGKPADPAALSFNARHYWTGNYMSPTPLRVLRDFTLLGAAAVPGLAFALRWWRPRSAVGDLDRKHPLAPPTRLLQGWGPSEPLNPLQAHFVVWWVAVLVGTYLVFAKLQLFAALALAMLVGLGFAATRRMRLPVRAAVFGLVLLSSAQGMALIPGPDLVVRMAQGEQPERWDPTVVFRSQDFSELARWLGQPKAEDEAVLASFVISPFLLTYNDRPVVLHTFFEGDLLGRLEEVVRARFGDEEGLWHVAQRYGATWYVHEAHHLLRDDKRMSQRYMAGRLDWPQDSVLARMSYAPRELKHFELVWENASFRVFRVLDEGERPRHLRSSAPYPLWSRSLFTALFGDPLGPGVSTAANGARPRDLLYGTLMAREWIERGLAVTDPEGDGWPTVERSMQVALEHAPYLVQPHEELERIYAAHGRPKRAAEHRAAARQLRAAYAHRCAFPEPLAPEPVPLERVR